MNNPRDVAPWAGRLSGRLILGVVLAATLVLAALHYWHFWQDPRPRWNGIAHDRNGHYEFAQKMALALREADLGTFFSTLEKAKIWPPVHGLCAALVLAVGGLDYRLAVLPSLAGWIMTTLFGFLLARRISGGCGNAAGVMAAVMILASPAHRIYGTDIMLESLGAGLTMLVLYLYAVARQEPSLPAWRRLAMALTVLLFEKYNYWMLVMLALVVAEVSGWRRQEWNRVAGFFGRVDWPRWWRGQFRQPLNYLFVAAALTTAVIFISKPAPFPVGTRTISLYPPNNLVTLTYAVLFIRVLWERKRFKGGLAASQLWKWHGLPVAISFLLPRRLSAFAWYLGPLNKGEQETHSLGEALSFYRSTLEIDYHVAGWSALGALLLFLLALVTCGRWRPGGRAVVWLALISAVSVVLHPNQKSRFLHSWLPAAWVAGAAGLATCIDRSGRFRRSLAATAGVAVTLIHAPSMAGSGHAPETGCRGEATSLLDLSDAYLPALANVHRVAVYSTVPCDQFVLWTHRERYPQRDAIELPVGGRSWSEELPLTTSAEAVLFIDSAEGLPGGRAESTDATARFGEWMRRNESFGLLQEWHLPQHDCTITLWSRESAAATSAAKITPGHERR